MWTWLLVAAAVATTVPLERMDSRDAGFSTRGERLYLRDVPFTGVQFEPFPNGVTYRETTYKDGKRNGPETFYSLEGGRRTSWNYKDGKKNGEQKAWFEDGAKRFVYHYRDGVFEGEQIEWHQNGTVFRRQVFHDGRETDRKILFQRGEIFSNFAKRDGRIFGMDGGSLCFDPKKDGER